MFARAATKVFDQGAGTLAAGAHIIQLGSGRSVTGLNITTDKALRYSAFWSAVRILSEDPAKLPFGVYRRRSDGGTDEVRTHPVDRVVRYRANDELSAFHWRETTMAHLLTWGNGYSLKRRDGGGNLRELRLLSTDRMDVDRVDHAYESVIPDPFTGQRLVIPFMPGDLRYRYMRVDGTRVDLSRAEVLHIPGLSWDGIKGYSVIKNARETVGLGLAAEEHGARFFGNGATVGFMLGTDNKLSDDAWRHLNTKLQSEKSGLSNAWQPWVLEEGLKPLSVSMPNDDAQWLETRKHQVTDIARWFRLQPHKLADLDRATFSNIEHQSLEYVTDALMGWLTRLESAMGMQLLGPEWVGVGGDLYLRFNVNALLRGDFQTRMAGYATGRQWGFLSANDIRRLEDMNPIPAEEGGDEYLRPLNMTTLNADGSITQTTMTGSRTAAGEGAAA